MACQPEPMVPRLFIHSFGRGSRAALVVQHPNCFCDLGNLARSGLELYSLGIPTRSFSHRLSAISLSLTFGRWADVDFWGSPFFMVILLRNRLSVSNAKAGNPCFSHGLWICRVGRISKLFSEASRASFACPCRMFFDGDGRGGFLFSE